MVATRAMRNQSGQAAVLATLCLFSMVVFLALSTNMGSVVNERIRMQNTADLSAYAGAYEQAAKLNDMAALNAAIQDVALYCRERLTQGPGPDIGGKGWNKVWNQCRAEEPFLGARPKLPIPPVLKTVGPLHDILPPPNSDTPPTIPSAGRRYGVIGNGGECNAHYDSRADDLITWCERTMDYYAQIIYDLNDYGSAYYGKPLTTSDSSLLRQRAIFSAVKNTAKRNYPKILDKNIEMLNDPEYSPVSQGRFSQEGIWDDDEPGYERPGGPSMVPLVRYKIRFNYIFLCCSKDPNAYCGPAKCGFSKNAVMPNLGHKYYEPPPVYYDPPPPPAYAFREVGAMYVRLAKGLVYMPVRVSSNPNVHNVPFLDNPSKNPDSNYFGGWGNWNDLRAVAVAKPYEGYLGPSKFQLDTEYGVNVVKPLPYMPWVIYPNGVFVAGPLEEMKQDGVVPHDTYRARMAGFREPLQDGTYRTMLDVLTGYVNNTNPPHKLPSDVDPGGYQYTTH